MAERAAHVLIDSAVVRIKHIVLLRQHVHGEAIDRHQLVRARYVDHNTDID